MASDFESSCTYQISYEMGSLRGWFLHVDQSYPQDYINYEKRRVVVHKTALTKWNITRSFYSKENHEPLYYICVANNGGPFSNWYLAWTPNSNDLYVTKQYHTERVLFTLPITQNTSKKLKNDKAKRMVQMSDSPCFYLRTNKKRDNFSYYPFFHKSQKAPSGSQVSWRIQEYGTNVEIEQELENLEENIEGVQDSIKQLNSELSYYKSKYSSLLKEIQAFQSLYKKQLDLLRERTKQLKAQNKPLEDKLNEEKHWKTKYERMKEKYESQRRKFDEQIDTLEVQVNKIYEERNQAEMDLYEKIADIERLTVKVKELEKNKEDNQYLARIQDSFNSLLQRYRQSIDHYTLSWQSWRKNHEKFKYLFEKLLAVNNKNIENKYIQETTKDIQDQNKQLTEWINFTDKYIDELEEEVTEKKQEFGLDEKMNKEGIQKLKTVLNEKQSQNQNFNDQLKYWTEKAEFMKRSYKQSKAFKLDELLVGLFQGKNANSYNQESELARLQDELDQLKTLYQDCKNQKKFREEEENLGEKDDDSETQTLEESVHAQNEFQDISVFDSPEINVKAGLLEQIILDSKINETACESKQIDKEFKNYYEEKYGVFDRSVLQAFDTIFSQSDLGAQTQKPQQNLFDQTYTDEQLIIFQNEVTQKQSTSEKVRGNNQMSVAVLKNGFDQVNHKSMIGFEIEVLENIGYFAFGVYNIKNLLEKMPQTIGKLWPNRHNYYLVDKYGNLLSRVENQTAKGRVSMKIEKGSVIRIECNKFSHSISFNLQSGPSQEENIEIQQSQNEQSRHSFKRYVKNLSKEDYRLCIVTQGSYNRFRVKLIQEQQ